MPATFRSFMSAPWSISTFKMLACLNRTAKCDREVPELSRELTSAPAFINDKSMPVLPFLTATWSSVADLLGKPSTLILLDGVPSLCFNMSAEDSTGACELVFHCQSNVDILGRGGWYTF